MSKESDAADYAVYTLLRPEIKRLAFQMENKFRMYSDRGDPFQPLSFTFLNERFADEWVELMLAMGFGNEPRKPPSEVWMEVADCCNFLTMIAVNYERVWRARVTNEEWVDTTEEV